MALNGMLDGWFQGPVLALFSRAKAGSLRLALPDGREISFGKPGAIPKAELKIRRTRFFRRLVVDGDIGLGESYVEGDWETPDLREVLRWGIANWGASGSEASAKPLGRAWDRLAHLLRPNHRRGARRNIHAHYDLGNSFYSLFLDPSLTYSCALYAKPGEDLQKAQERKIARILDRAKVRKGEHLLEIGTGWGALCLAAARRGCRVTTTTISKEQHALAAERVRRAGLQDQVKVEYRDYRDLKGNFDRIVSVEMLEAVGERHFSAFFSKVAGLLKPGGLVSLQTIALPDERFESYRRGCDWIQKHIFPGALVPSLGYIRQTLAEEGRLRVQDAKDIGLHYGPTLAEWRRRFMAKISKVRALGFDDCFIRKWEYYLSYCQVGFETGLLLDYQLVISQAETNPA